MSAYFVSLISTQYNQFAFQALQKYNAEDFSLKFPLNNYYDEDSNATIHQNKNEGLEMHVQIQELFLPYSLQNCSYNFASIKVNYRSLLSFKK